jgi:hypothetical protein
VLACTDRAVLDNPRYLIAATIRFDNISDGAKGMVKRKRRRKEREV